MQVAGGPWCLISRAEVNDLDLGRAGNWAAEKLDVTGFRFLLGERGSPFFGDKKAFLLGDSELLLVEENGTLLLGDSGTPRLLGERGTRLLGDSKPLLLGESECLLLGESGTFLFGDNDFRGDSGTRDVSPLINFRLLGEPGGVVPPPTVSSFRFLVGDILKLNLSGPSSLALRTDLLSLVRSKLATRLASLADFLGEDNVAGVAGPGFLCNGNGLPL